MEAIRGLNEFCRKYKIPIKGGDDFNLLEFLLSISHHSIPLAEYSGQIKEVINNLSRVSKDSDVSSSWGGCPRCGSNIHLGLGECPICGLALVEPEEVTPQANVEAEEVSPEDNLGNIDPSYNERDEEDDEDKDNLDEIEALASKAEQEEQKAKQQPPKVQLKKIPPLPSKRTEIEKDEFDDEVTITKPASKGETEKPNDRSSYFRREISPHAEKAKARYERRNKLEALLPKFKKYPDLIDKLQYRDLLIMPGLLGFLQRPTGLGHKNEIIAWVKNALLEGAHS